jgi:hypothetical protein
MLKIAAAGATLIRDMSAFGGAKPGGLLVAPIDLQGYFESLHSCQRLHKCLMFQVFLSGRAT